MFQVIWSALEAVRAGSTCESRELDTASKAGCLHKWAIMPTLGPPSSEDIIRQDFNKLKGKTRNKKEFT